MCQLWSLKTGRSRRKDGVGSAKKVLQIGYEPERDRLTWDGWDIHCGQSLNVLIPDKHGKGTWQLVSFEYNENGWYIPRWPGVSPVGLWGCENELPLY